MTGTGKLLIQFLKNVETIVIPVYQRNYDWKIEHCRKLLDDLCSTVARRRMHFFGGIVSVNDPTGGTFDFLIIDGQQRLTTVSLLVLAMANLIKDKCLTPKDPLLYDTLTKKFLVDDINPQHRKLKLKPIEGDRSAYEKLYDPDGDYEKNSNITQNYLFFYNEIPKCGVSVDDLYYAIQRLQIIDISLTMPEDDPQLVFESLNSTGLDLNEGDKIRNFILMGQTIADQDHFYNTYWKKIEKDAGSTTQSNSYDVSPFIRDYLTIQLRRIPSMKEIYSLFKSHATSEKWTSNTEGLLKELRDYARRYKKILDGWTDFPIALKASLYRLNHFESSVTRPFLMEVFRIQEEGIITYTQVASVCRTIESYLLRRVICDLPSNTLNKVFLTLFNDVKRLDNTFDQFEDKVKYILASKKEKAAFPTDEEFSDCFVRKNVYLMPPRYRSYILERLENGDSQEYKEVYTRLDSGEYSIEHIMPQKLTPAWSSELGSDQASQIHSEWLHRIANLTISAAPYNSHYSNATFHEKKTMDNGYIKSGIKLTQRLAVNAQWGLPELLARSKELTASALTLWPYASTGYTAPEKQYDEFTLDEGISFTGLNLVKYRFRGIEHPATSWVDMFYDVITTLHRENATVLNFLADAGDDVELSCYVGRTESQFIKAAKIEDGLYIFTNTSTQSKINLLIKFFERYNEDTSNLVLMTDDKQPDHADLAERHIIRKKYWQSAIGEIQKTTGTFLNCGNTVNNTMFGSTGRSGVYVSCIANFDSARIEFYIDTGNRDKNKAYFDLLFSHRLDIEAAFGAPLQWNRSDELRASKVIFELKGVSITNEADWPAMIQFHAQKGKLLLDAFRPYLDI